MIAISAVGLIAISVLGGGCVNGVCVNGVAVQGHHVVAAKVVQQKVIVEPAAAAIAQTVVQTDQFGGQRVVVTAPAAVHHAHVAPQAVYTSSHDGGAAQQNAAILQLLAQSQANQQTIVQALIQQNANQQAFAQQVVAAGVNAGLNLAGTASVTAAAGVNVQGLRQPALGHPGERVFVARCLRCHGAENPAGGVDLSILDDEKRNASLAAILMGTMPKGETLTTEEERALAGYLGRKSDAIRAGVTGN